jgi:trk system potassium uptake protein
VVDNNPALVRRATDTLDVQGVTGFASHPDVLEPPGARDADMIIAATFSDEVNMVTCQVAHSSFGHRARSRACAASPISTRYSDLYRRDHLPIDVVIINPEREVAEAALSASARPRPSTPRISSPATRRCWGSRWPRVPGAEHPAQAAVGAVLDAARHRRGRAARRERCFVPEPGDQLFENDQIYVFTHARTCRARSRSSARPPPPERVVSSAAAMSA